MKAFAKKIAMTHVYDDKGRHCAVTVLELLKTRICAIRQAKGENPSVVVYGLYNYGKEANKSTKAQFGEYGEGLIKSIEERIEKNDGSDEHKLGEEITKTAFSEGTKVSIRSRSKGKGFSGTVKRHGFQTGPKTHGSHNYRQPGSIGDTNPARVVKGRRMPGHMGYENKTTKDMEILKIETDLNRIWVRGALAGANKSLVVIEKND